MVLEIVHEDMGDGNIQCTNHPYKNSTPPGGICAFCLQEKLGKLVSSSSFPLPIFPSSSSSSSPSFRSDFGCSNTTGGGAAAAAAARHHLASSSRLPFVVPTHKTNKKKDVGVGAPAAATAGGGGSSSAAVVLNRSKSTTAPRRAAAQSYDESFDLSPHRRGFWSFLYSSKRIDNKHHSSKDPSFTPATPSTVCSSTVGSSSIRSRAAAAAEKKREDYVVVDENDSSPDESAFDRKVSRSRSVGCGSRSFSGDFFERISTGFGDCALRRVESQREGKPKIGGNGQERVKCGGIFSGFMITSSSSSSSSSSNWDNNNRNNNAAHSSVKHRNYHNHNLPHGRSKSWGWALASPMRAFGKNSTTTGKRDAVSTKNAAPNLAAIPSLLAVSG